MRVFGQFALTVAAFSVSHSFSYAQDCGAVLSAAYDTSIRIGSKEHTRAFKSALCSSEQDTDNFQLGGKYYAIEGDLGISEDERKSLCSNQESYEHLDEKLVVAARKVHDNTIGAWERCMNSDGAKASLLFTDDPANMLLVTQFRPFSSNTPPTAKIDRIFAQNLQCDGLPVQGGEIGNRKTYPCKRDPYQTSTLSINLSNINSPNPLRVGARPKPIRPIYNISGSYATPSGVVHVNQTGSKLSWSYNTPQIQHSFDGIYLSDREAFGRQLRTITANRCTVQMKIVVTARGHGSFCHRSTIDASSKETCDLPRDFHENVCFPLQ